MPNPTEQSSDRDGITRRSILTHSAGAATALVGMGALSGSGAAAPWVRFDTDFRGCTEVWLIVHKDDLLFDPPTVAHVIVTAGDSTDCILVEFTTENATRIPGQYDDPVVKVEAPPGEKVLAVIEYNYRPETDPSVRFEDPRCPAINDHTCANTPNVPDFREADCFQNAVSIFEEKQCPIPELSTDSGPPGQRGPTSGQGSRGRRGGASGHGPPGRQG